ncbi:hypothetical protein Lal_00005157 [Lupinus albus]|nr:hypothetical protein Lal_00005157 [Lupinus albus]
MSIQRFHIGPRMSQMVVHKDTVYLAGQVADEPTPDVERQTIQILAQIDALLAEAGSDKSKLLSTTIYLADIASFGAMNKAWDAWVDPANPPARATVEAKLAAPQSPLLNKAAETGRPGSLGWGVPAWPERCEGRALQYSDKLLVGLRNVNDALTDRP